MDVDASSSSSPPTTSSVAAQTPPEPTSPATPPSTSPLNTAQPSSPSSEQPAESTPSSSTSPSTNLIHNLILSYLIHNCYEKTAIALLAAHGDEHPVLPSTSIMTDIHDLDNNTNVKLKNPEHTITEITSSPPLLSLKSCNNNYHLLARLKMMTFINKGDIQPALILADDILKRHKNSCTLRTAYPEAYSRALCQHYVELIRVNDNLTALSFARSTIRPFSMQYNDAFVRLQKYLPLLAYDKPESAPMFDLLDVSHRNSLAEYLNGCIVACLTDDTDTLCTIPLLGRGLRQLTHVMRKLKGENWSLDDIWDDDTKME